MDCYSIVGHITTLVVPAIQVCKPVLFETGVLKHPGHYADPITLHLCPNSILSLGVETYPSFEMKNYIVQQCFQPSTISDRSIVRLFYGTFKITKPNYSSML